MSTDFFGREGPAMLERRSGELVPTAEALVPFKYVLVYFSAHWCPPCRGFTPQLKRFYEANAAPKSFTVVFVSLDHTAAEMRSYFREAHGDWLAVPFASVQKLAQPWSRRYGISSIPTLLVFENLARGNSANTPLPNQAEGRRLITQGGRTLVPMDMQAETFPWPTGDAIAAASDKKMKRVGVLLMLMAVIVIYFTLFS